MNTATWTDPFGTEREGELLDQATVDHPKQGKCTASLFRGCITDEPGNPRVHLEVYVHATRHTSNARTIPSEAQGRELMAKFRASV